MGSSRRTNLTNILNKAPKSTNMMNLEQGDGPVTWSNQHRHVEGSGAFDHTNRFDCFLTGIGGIGIPFGVATIWCCAQSMSQNCWDDPVLIWTKIMFTQLESMNLNVTNSLSWLVSMAEIWLAGLHPVASCQDARNSKISVCNHRPFLRLWCKYEDYVHAPTKEF